MSYSVTLTCGCDVHVSCHPITGIARTRVIERRHPECRVGRHEIGVRVWLWELLPGGRGAGSPGCEPASGRSALREW